jgi:hypothetical protein
MEELVIYRSEAEHECEVCGSSWEESYHTFFKGQQIGKYAVAHCFGAENTTFDDVVREVLQLVGYKVRIEECEYE